MYCSSCWGSLLERSKILMGKYFYIKDMYMDVVRKIQLQHPYTWKWLYNAIWFILSLGGIKWELMDDDIVLINLSEESIYYSTLRENIYCQLLIFEILKLMI